MKTEGGMFVCHYHIVRGIIYHGVDFSVAGPSSLSVPVHGGDLRFTVELSGQPPRP